MTGTLQINGALDNKIDPLLCRADGYYMSFGVTKDGDVFAGASSSSPFLATENWHVVTKGYLDSQITQPETKGFTFKFKGYSQDHPDNAAEWDARSGEFWSHGAPDETGFLYFSLNDINGKQLMLPEYGSGSDHHELVTFIEEGATGNPRDSNKVLADGRKVAYYLRMKQCLRDHYREGPVGNKHDVYYGYSLVFTDTTTTLKANTNYTIIFGTNL